MTLFRTNSHNFISMINVFRTTIPQTMTLDDILVCVLHGNIYVDTLL